MISGLLAALIPILILVSGCGAVAAAAYWWRADSQRQARRSPLVRDLLRPPGHSLRLKIGAIDSDLALYALGSLAVPLLAYAIHVSQSYFGGVPESVLRIAVSVGFVLIAEIWIGRRLWWLLQERKTAALGLDGELATAEELNQLMLDGCRVFHDIPIHYGNVDHVVVSHSGVYAVNTKSLGKPRNGGNADVVVDHEKNVIRFPDRNYAIPIGKLSTEARWLSDYLTKAVGKPVAVESMIALPGWCIKERIGRGSIYVFNPRNPQKFFVQNRQVLSPETVQQVAHQLEQLCRNVEAVFQEKKGWENKT